MRRSASITCRNNHGVRICFACCHILISHNMCARMRDVTRYNTTCRTKCPAFCTCCLYSTRWVHIWSAVGVFDISILQNIRYIDIFNRCFYIEIVEWINEMLMICYVICFVNNKLTKCLLYVIAHPVHFDALMLQRG